MFAQSVAVCKIFAFEISVVNDGCIDVVYMDETLPDAVIIHNSYSYEL